MNESPPATRGLPPLPRHLDQVCDRFEAAWKEVFAGGPRPRLEEFLGDTTGLELQTLVLELLGLEAGYRHQLGETPSLDEYRQRFPGLPPEWLAHELILRGRLAVPPEPAGLRKESALPAMPQGALSDPESREKSAGGGLSVSGQTPPAGESWWRTPQGMSVQRSGGEAVPDMPERIGRFEVRALLGEGAFGRVYRAFDGQLEREVAVKVARGEVLNQPRQVERFLREARAAARLRHPHIVPLFEAGKEGTSYFIASAFIPGQTLAAFLMPGPPDFARTVQVLRALADALAYAHEQGIVHRDVKPANVMLDDKGQPLLTDFGLAARLDETERLTHEGTILGTPLYMAPEQAAGRLSAVGPASDQYSLGVILYEMLCARTPFRGPAQAVLHDQMHSDPPPPRRHDRRIPRDLETVCLKALVKKPAERYPSCRELADDLRRWLEGEPIKARQASLLEQAVKLARRNPVAARLGAVAVLLLLLIGLGASLYLWRENGRLQESQKSRDEFHNLLHKAVGLREKRNWTEARTVLKSAQAGLRHHPDLRDEALKQDIERQLAGVDAEQAAETEAHDRRRQFLPLHNDALFYGTPFTALDPAGNQSRLQAAIREALALYNLAGDGDLPAGVTAVLDQDRPYLTAAEHAELASACFELLLAWADAAVTDTPEAHVTTAQRQQQAERALARLERAAQLGRAAGLETGTYLLRKARYQAWGQGERFTPTREQLAAAQPHSALDWFQAALESYRAGRHQEAAVTCEKALSLDPRQFWARYVQALCQLQAGRWADGRATLTICLDRRPDFVWALLLRGLAATQLGDSAGNAHLFTAARADLDQALRQDRTPLVQYVGLANRGVLFIRQEKWPEAIKDLQEALRLKDDGYSGYLNLARAYQGLGQGDRALAVLNQAIGKAPRLAVFYEARARLHQERKELDAARADFEKAISLESPGSASPRLADNLLRLGRLLEYGHETGAALERYDEALKVEPDNALAHRYRGEALLVLGRGGEAAEALDRYLQLERQPLVQVYRARGLLYVHEGKYAAAVEAYTLALQKEPDDVATRCYRGWAYLLQDAARPALTDFETSLKQQPGKVEALLGRGNALVRLRQIDAAVADARAADKAGSLSETQLYNLTCIYALAAAQLELDRRGNRDPLTARRIADYEDTALACLKRWLEKVAPERRSAFWREKVQTDPALTAIRRGPSYFELAARLRAAGDVM